MVPPIEGKDDVSTPQVSGGHLAGLATDSASAGTRGGYWAVKRRQLVELRPSALARDDAACAKLWDDSVALAGPRPA